MPQSSSSVLKPNQRVALQLIASGLSRKYVATKLQIDPATLSRWRRQPEFQRELDEMLATCERESVETFRATKIAAVERLASLINSANQKVALQAIGLVLSKTDLQAVTWVDPDSHEARSKRQFDKILDQLLAP